MSMLQQSWKDMAATWSCTRIPMIYSVPDPEQLYVVLYVSRIHRLEQRDEQHQM
jgi:hypothetical protein